MHLGIGGLGEGVEIGVGASAAVFRARQVDLDRDVAVKILTATDDAFIRRFNREAKTLGKLSEHSGIVTVYDTGVNESGQPYLILELCEDSLLGWLEKTGPVEALAACRHMARVTGAVASAHEEGVVHRDIKPANILISADGRAMVTDFGIATNTGVGETNSVGFTASYVAPETINGRVAGAPGDVYSLGATLFHLVSGETAFTSGDGDTNIVALAKRIATEPVPDLRRRGIPTEVCQVIEWAMTKDPDVRPTAAALHEALEIVASGGRADTSGANPPGGQSGNPAGGAKARETAEVLSENQNAGDSSSSANAATTRVTPGPVAGTDENIVPPQLPRRGEGEQAGQQNLPTGVPSGGILDFGSQGPAEPSGGGGSSDDGLFPGAAGISLPTASPPNTPGPMVDRRDMFVAPDSMARTYLLTGAAVVLAFLVFGGGALLLLNRDNDDGVAAGTEDEAPASPEVEPGNSQSGSFDPAGPPELRPNLGNAVTRLSTPDVAGLTEIRAEQEILAAGLRVNTVYRENSSVPVGQVITQDPAAGSQVQEDSLVTIFVSRRTDDPPKPLPGVAGLTVIEATAALEDEGFSVGEQRSIYHDSVPAGVVVGTDPPVDTLVNAESAVILFVSLGQPKIPDVVGLTTAAATAALEAVTLTVEVVTGPGAGAVGTVESSTPVAGTAVAIDSLVQILVVDEVIPTCSVDVATLIDKPAADAEALVVAADCVVGAAAPTEFSATIADGNVIRATIDGQSVQLVVSKGVQPLPCDAADLATLVVDIGDLTRAEAVAQVQAINCTVGADLPPEISGTVAVGKVIRGEVTDTTVRLVLSAETCTIPAVVGVTIAAAKTAITSAGCTGAVATGGAADTAVVGGVTPVAGSVIVVNDGITLIAEVAAPVVPNVVGLTQAAAETAITADGFVAAVVTTPLPAGSANIGLVTAQTPAGGVVGTAGATVTITVGVAEPAPGP